MPNDATGFAAILAGIFALLGLQARAKEANKALPQPPIPRRKPVMLNEPKSVSLDDLYKKHGRQKGVDWRLLKAHAIIESSERPTVKNPADPSYGLMQILCQSACLTCRCTNKFNINGWSEATPEKLLEPDFNLHIASQIVRWNLDTYGIPKGIAVYNAFSARLDPDSGPFRNQSYVDKVVREWRALGGGEDTFSL